MEIKDNVIELKNITQSFQDKTVLNDLSVNFTKGKVTALLGKSGSGKSTLLQIINGMIKPQKGEIKVLGKCCSTDFTMGTSLSISSFSVLVRQSIYWVFSSTNE